MKGFPEAVDYLYGLQFHGIKFGLNNTLKLLGLLGNPHRSFKSVHIAGTNGKGSTSAFLASILGKAGFRAGHFTSPHLTSFTERIRIDGIKISEAAVVNLTNHIRDLIKQEPGLSPTFFEFVTAMAFFYFREQGVQWAVIETGMGGRLDATNVLSPEATVITRIGMDHREYLGNTPREIAGEKAGIIKENIPVITASQEREVEEVISHTAAEKKAPLFVYGRDFSSEIREAGITGSRFNYSSGKELSDIRIPLAGEFQIENASLALKAAEVLHNPAVDEAALKSGLSSVQWEGRCELYREWKFPLLFDGAHNPDAARALRRALEDLYRKEFECFILVIGMMGDKDIQGFLSSLLPVALTTIFTTLGFQRAARAEYLQSVAAGMGYESRTALTMSDALSSVQRVYRNGSLAVITGSFYAVGEAKGALGFDSSLLGLTEFR